MSAFGVYMALVGLVAVVVAFVSWGNRPGAPGRRHGVPAEPPDDDDHTTRGWTQEAGEPGSAPPEWGEDTTRPWKGDGPRAE